LLPFLAIICEQVRHECATESSRENPLNILHARQGVMMVHEEESWEDFM
jgi:hypothetical protein